MTVHVVAYGSGNIRSIVGAFERIGVAAIAQPSPEGIASASHVLLPGVGAFADAMERLVRTGWAEAIRQHVVAGRQLLGICLGMQLLASVGTEGGPTTGLNLIPGQVVHLTEASESVRVPHVGWNDVAVSHPTCILDGVPPETNFYFSHSYILRPDDNRCIIGTVEYGTSIVAAVEEGTVAGVQFHPEKSSRAGLRVLKNFARS